LKVIDKFDYGRTATIYFPREDPNHMLIVNRGRAPFQNPQVRMCHWWRYPIEYSREQALNELDLSVFVQKKNN